MRNHSRLILLWHRNVSLRIAARLPPLRLQPMRVIGRMLGSGRSCPIDVTNGVAKLAIPLIKPHLTEQGLLELWASKTPGGFELPNLKYKSILLALQNRFDELPQAFQRMREISAGNLADTGTQEHIARLKERFSLPE